MVSKRRQSLIILVVIMRVESPTPPYHGISALLGRGSNIRDTRRRQTPAIQEESSHQEMNTCTLILDFQAYGILLQQLMKTNPEVMVVLEKWW